MARCGGHTALRHGTIPGGRRTDHASCAHRAARVCARAARGARPPGLPPRRRRAAALRTGRAARPAPRALGPGAPGGPARLCSAAARPRAEARRRGPPGGVARPRGAAASQGGRAPRVDAYVVGTARAAGCHRGGRCAAVARPPLDRAAPLPRPAGGGRLAGVGAPVDREGALRWSEGGAHTPDGGPASRGEASVAGDTSSAHAANVGPPCPRHDAVRSHPKRHHRAPGPSAPAAVPPPLRQDTPKRDSGPDDVAPVLRAAEARQPQVGRVDRAGGAAARRGDAAPPALAGGGDEGGGGGPRLPMPAAICYCETVLRPCAGGYSSLRATATLPTPGALRRGRPDRSALFRGSAAFLGGAARCNMGPGGRSSRSCATNLQGTQKSRVAGAIIHARPARETSFRARAAHCDGPPGAVARAIWKQELCGAATDRGCCSGGRAARPCGATVPRSHPSGDRRPSLGAAGAGTEALRHHEARRHQSPIGPPAAAARRATPGGAAGGARRPDAPAVHGVPLDLSAEAPRRRSSASAYAGPASKAPLPAQKTGLRDAAEARARPRGAAALRGRAAGRRRRADAGAGRVDGATPRAVQARCHTRAIGDPRPRGPPSLRRFEAGGRRYPNGVALV